MESFVVNLSPKINVADAPEQGDVPEDMKILAIPKALLRPFLFFSLIYSEELECSDYMMDDGLNGLVKCLECGHHIRRLSACTLGRRLCQTGHLPMDLLRFQAFRDRLFVPHFP